MYQIDVPSAAPSLPAPAALGSPGFFTDGSVAGGVQPTVVTADFMNAMMLELLNVVAGGGLAPSKTANNQMFLAIQNMIEARSGNYARDTGVANAYVVALSPAVSSLSGLDGLQVKFRSAHANTGGCTLNVGAGAIPLLRDDGAAMQSGDIPIGSIVSCTYDLLANAFLANSIVLSQTASQAQVQTNAFGYATDGGMPNVYQAAYTPAVTSLTDGMVLEFKAANANTGPATFSPNGLTAKAIVGGAHAALQGGEIAPGGEVEVMWHAALNSWVLLGCTGGALQVGVATKSAHAVTLGQLSALLAPADLYFFGQL